MSQPPPLPESRRCSQCGADVQAAANFCYACGAPLQKSAVAPQSVGQNPRASRPKSRPELAFIIGLLLLIGLLASAAYLAYHSQSNHFTGSASSITTPTFRESIEKELAEGNAIMAENAKYLRLVKSSWKFDESHRHVVWTVTIENKSNASIGNIIFSTRYADRHGNILQFHNGENGDEANKLDLGINGPIKAHSSKTFTVLDDITEPMVILDAEKASFTIVGAGDWMQRVLK